ADPKRPLRPHETGYSPRSRNPVTPTPRPAAVAVPLSRSAFVLSRLRRNAVLQASAVLAFFEYGGLLIWAIFGRSTVEGSPRLGTWFPMASWLALCSLGSWFFLFLWYGSLQVLEGNETGDGNATRMGRVLE